MTQQLIDLTPEMTVSEIVQKYPRSLRVLKAFGIDTCCGGAQPLGVVLVKHELEDAQVMEALKDVLSQG
jgi:iron-sulfur cluster repair protein YtfE (RIC family)